MKNQQNLLVFIILLSFSSFAQTNTTLYKGQKGDNLLTNITKDFKTSKVLDYNGARDKLWAFMAAQHNGNLIGVYTGYTISIDTNGSAPRTEAYKKGINCEHTWPQSLGMLNGNKQDIPNEAKCDMHHLFPTREEANSTRGNYPFSEIDDSKTDKWFKDNIILTSTPTADINLYSEFESKGLFEPREDHKGNVARAIFYMYTMYKVNLDASFFKSQMLTLYKWHVLDPIDNYEIARNNFIATQQGNKKNPYILDSSLIRRAYFPQWANEAFLLAEPKTHIIFSGLDSIVEFVISTSADTWTTSCDKDWIQVTSDYDNNLLIVKVDENNDEFTRQAYITIKADGIPDEVISIIQDGFNSTSIKESDELAKKFNVFPNPFDDKLSFSFMIEEPSYVQILIFDSKGQALETHFNFYPEKGSYNFDIETISWEPGYYYYNFILNDMEKKDEIILVR